MKKLTILIFTLLLSSSLYSQESPEFWQMYTDTVVESIHDTNCIEVDKSPFVLNPPQFYIIDGDTVGVILSVEQVQKIDSDLEMLKLFKQLDVKVQDVDNFYITVINNQNEKISILETTLKNIREQSTGQEDMISSLKRQLKIRTEQYELSEEQIFNDSVIIDGLKKDLKKQKRKTIGAIAGAGAGGLGLLILTIFFLK